MAGGSGVADGGWARRYPALAWLAGAVALAMLLPSGLNVPNSGPSSLAEYAPVPGQGQGESPVAELGQASSGDLGAGAGVVGIGATTTTRPAAIGRTRVIRKPGTKRCVGNPPRQTEDPLSPPCVAFFEGDNFGATARGVTADEITIVVWAAGGSEPRFDDWSAAPDPTDESVNLMGKAFVRFFEARYQTYGRRLKVWSYRGPATAVEDYAAGAQRIMEKNPFAFVTMQKPALSGPAAARSGVVTATFASMGRSSYREVAPHLFSFNPDIEDQSALVADYVCSKLVGKPVKHSGDRTYRGQPRSFGLAWEDNTTEPAFRELATRVKADVGTLCGLSFTREVGVVPGASGNVHQSVAALRADGITTVLVLMTGGLAGAMGNAAGGTGYLPEWVIGGGGTGDNGPDRNGAAQLTNQATWAGAFGITFDYRRGPIEEQAWYRAAAEGCPTCEVPRSTEAPKLYDAMTMLLYGIQAAGPRLTVANVDKGMHAIPPRGSADPFKPAAYFAPGNYSYVKDAAEIWWDPAGQAPSDSRPGCYRLVDDGARRRPGEFSPDDSAVFRPGAPCQGSPQRPASA